MKRSKRAPRKLERKKQRSSWPVAYKWAAMGTLIVYTAVGAKTVSIAYGQQVPPSKFSGSPVPSKALPVRRFEIPAGSLGEVLESYRTVSRLQVQLSDDAMRSIPSPGVSGLYTVEQALRALLADTGITCRFTGAGAAVLEFARHSTSVQVSERVEPLVSAKYAQRMLDTPQSIDVVPQQVIRDQGTTTLRDTLRNVAGISLAAGEGGSQGDNLTIRGFTARNDIFLDGMRDFGSYYRDPFNMEEVEVLQGPSSVTFGRGTTGGIVNQESKTPQANRFFAGGIDFGTDSTRRGTADINVPVPRLGAGTEFRLNLMGDEGNIAGRDIAENRRYGVAPSLSFAPGASTRLTFSYLRQSEDDIPDYGIPWLFNHVTEVNRANYYGFEHGNFLRADANVATVKFQHDFRNNITMQSQTRYANYGRDVQITEAKVAGNITPSTPLNAITVNRNQIAVDSVETFLQNQTDVTARFETGFVKHTLVSGVEGGRETSAPTRFAFTGVPGTSLLFPDTDQPFQGQASISSQVKTTALSVAAYVLDTVKLGQKWEVTGGVRWDRFNPDYRQQIAPISAFSRVDEMTSWRGAVVYKPTHNGSIYVDYGTSFNPSAESLSLSAAVANTAPEKNATYEAGTKWELLAGRLSLRSAIFRTQKTGAREPDPNNPIQNVLGGNQRVDGVQFDVNGRLTNRWQILSSYAYLDGKVVKSEYYPASVGGPLANVPANTFNVWTTYDFPWKNLQTGAGANFAGARAASSTAPTDPVTGLLKEVPGYWVFNAMLRYPLTERVSIQANAYNLTNRYYYDQIHPGHIVPGPGRSLMMGLQFKF